MVKLHYQDIINQFTTFYLIVTIILLLNICRQIIEYKYLKFKTFIHQEVRRTKGGGVKGREESVLDQVKKGQYLDRNGVCQTIGLIKL